MRGAAYWYFIPSTVCLLVSFWLRAARWKVLTAPFQEIRVSQLFSATMIGYMANNILPLRLGEFVRAWALARTTEVRTATVLATLLVERIFDAIFSALLLGLVLLLFPDLPAWLTRAGMILVIGILLLTFVAFLLRNPSGLLGRAGRTVSRLFPERYAGRIKGLFGAFSEGLEFLGDAHRYPAVIAISLSLWPFYIGTVWLALLAFDLHLGLIGSLVILMFVTIALIIPAAPSALGTFHGFVVAALALYHVQPDIARAFAVVLHMANFIPITFVGVYYLWRQNLRFADLRGEKVRVISEDN